MTGYQVGDLTIDLGRQQVTRGGSNVSLPHLSFDLLVALVQAAPDLISFDQLAERVWPGLVITPETITQRVKLVRQALGDDPHAPRYISGVRGRGYRVVAVVRPLVRAQAGAGEDSPHDASAMAALHSRARSVPTWLWRTGAVMLAVALTSLLVGAGFAVLTGNSIWGWYRSAEREGSTTTRIQSLAVLPLANLSGDPSQDYFAQGMTDELITELAKITSLRVISRTSVVRYQRTQKTLPQIGKELRVDAIVQGAVVSAGTKLRITAQLITTGSDKHLWADSYERDLGDVLTLQSEVARAIAKQVNATLAGDEQARVSRAFRVSARARDAYLRGLFFWNKWTEEDIRRSIDYYHQAIEADPDYAPAYAGLANSYISLGDLGVGVLMPNRANAAAEEAALKAVSLDDALAEGHVALAMSRFHSGGDLGNVEKEFKRALELNPGAAPTHHWYSHYLLAVGRDEEALAEGERAYDLSPVDPEMGVHMQFLYLFLHRYDQVLEQGRRTLELDRNFSETRFMNGQAYELQHRYREAAAEMQAAVELSGRRSMILASYSHLLAVSGDRRGAQSILDEFNVLSRQRYVPSYEYALIYMGLGDTEAALKDLKKACDEGSSWIFTLPNDARFDPVRADPRFHELLRRAGISR